MFSHECISLFKWVTDLIDLFFNLFNAKPITNFDSYLLYSLIFPISILFFITLKSNKLLYLILYGLFLGAGAFFGLFANLIQFCFIPIIAFGIFFAMSSPLQKFFANCFKSKVENERIEDDVISEEENLQLNFHFSFCFLGSSFILCLLLIPIYRDRYSISILLIIIIPLIIIIVFCIELINFFFFNNSFNTTYKYSAKMILFINNILTLLIVPSTEKFISNVTVNEYYRKQWCFYFSYIIINVLIPIIVSIVLVKGEHSSAIEKYRQTKSNCLYYLNVIDLIKQIIYAFFSSFDIVYGCLSVEVIWLLMMIFLHPFSKVSDYFFTFFTSILIIAGNSVTILSTFKTIGPLSLGQTIVCFILICIPAIVSMYTYFIFDFKTDDIQDDEMKMEDIDESSENENDNDVADQMGIIMQSFTSFAFFLYGSNIHLFDSEYNE